MKVKPDEVEAIGGMLENGNPDPESWKYYCERLLLALDEVCDQLEPLRVWL
jgi:hypothetical protein